MGCSPNISKKNTAKTAKNLTSRSITIKSSIFSRLTTNPFNLHYEEIRILGSGAFAEVFLCMHCPTNTHRAVKKIEKATISDSQKSRKFLLNEFNILRSLDHPNILKCFEVFQDTRFCYISTEYCPAGDLFTEVVKLKKLSEPQVADIVFELLSALAYCHEKKIIHRDLKPENIFLLEKGEFFTIKVGDFGNSALICEKSKTTGCYGSAYYLAPEIFSDSYNEKCDIWSVGIIMFILLTGRPPYPGRDGDSIISHIKKSPFVPSPLIKNQMSENAVDLLKKLVTIKPEKRISAKEAVMHPWITSRREGKTTDIEVALNNLKNFHSESKIQQAVKVFVASQIASYEELKYFKESFQRIDRNGDGKITRDELIFEYSKVMSLQDAQKVTDGIIEKLDQDLDGEIDYTEFLVSCSDIQLGISLDKLESAFQAFDLDGSGTITVEEIKELMSNGVEYDEAIWKTILQEADDNNDGQIDLREFIGLMSSVKSRRINKII